MTSENNSTMAYVMKNFKIDVFLKNNLRSISCYISTFEQKTAFSVIYKPKSAGNWPFFAVFVYFERHVSVFDSFDSLTTTLCLDTPPTNGRSTMQFLSGPHSL